MKKRTVITGILGILLLISCGPKRYGCGPNRRCEIQQNSTKTPLEKQSFKKEAVNS
ncbi:hypothetical protein [Flavobacterium sp.]|uniref:hypothetical protein n=1 Tax=Flavobacterium sp. TaxID=239 RepID=UPI003D28B8F3